MKTKNNQFIVIITSVMCLLPILLSFVLYKDLPDQIAIHWNSAGEANNFIPKALAAFGLPVLFVAINIYSKIRFFNDPKRGEDTYSLVMQMISIWLPPVLSLILVPVTLFIALGLNVPITLITSAILGVLLILIGNHLPKCRQNYTIGIKLPWTLHDANNWNKTHRMAGHLWVLGGLSVLASTFLFTDKTAWGISVTVLIVILLVTLPMLYSYRLFKSEKQR